MYVIKVCLTGALLNFILGTSYRAVQPVTAREKSGEERATHHRWSNACQQRSLSPLQRRAEIGRLLEEEGFTKGAELGVQHGTFANETLQSWTSCKQYILVDVWAPQSNYVDLSNEVDHNAVYADALAAVEPWKEKVTVHRMYTTDAVEHIPDNSLDYVYVDARHDYCGVTTDLHLYWPKLRPNGILAGHDYLTNEEVVALTPSQDWSVCSNGTVVNGAVKGAVNDFAEAHGLTVTLLGTEAWPSFGIRKPCYDHSMHEKK